MPAGRSPDTIVLVHGFWVTPRSWEHWVSHFVGSAFRASTATSKPGAGRVNGP